MRRLFARLFGKRPVRSTPSPLSSTTIAEIQRRIGYSFNDTYYLTKALTHRSFLRANEPRNLRSYERLEFLGDSVLGLIVAEELFQKYPDMSEGSLTKNKSLLVNKKVLAHTGMEIDLGNYILMSADEERAGGRTRPSIVADCLEAMFGAVYLDGGLEPTRQVIKRLISLNFDEISDFLSLRNFKGELLERLQAGGGGLPKYTVSDEDGPDHRKVFTVEVFVSGRRLGTGRGDSKKSAEQRAAESALAALDEHA
ncbi:MAG: ribonuclease III [candidate division Zixibacteria bacterium]|nr:ribonuclease III [candidate division Zixibacteria bacterium]